MALKILVLSTTNSTLGPMTQGFLDYYSSKKTQVLSAGIHPLPIHSMALKVMDSLGIPVEKSRMDFTDVEEINFDYIITFSDKAHQLAKEKAKKAQVFHLKMDNLDKTQGTDKELKNAFKSSRKELQAYCTEFAEQYLQKKIKKS
jgi:arsenate reductase